MEENIPFSTLLHRTFGAWVSLQACLSRITLLKARRSLNPMPPCLSFVLITPIFLQWRPALDAFVFHQIDAIFYLMALQMDIWILKIDITHNSKACTTALIRISFPALEINFSFWPSSFMFIDAMIQMNIFFLDWAVWWNPQVLPYLINLWNSRFLSHVLSQRLWTSSIALKSWLIQIDHLTCGETILMLESW